MKAIHVNTYNAGNPDSDITQVHLTPEEMDVLIEVWDLSWDLDVSEYETSDTNSVLGEDIPILRRLAQKGLVISEPIHASIDQFDTRWSTTFDDKVAVDWDVFWERRGEIWQKVWEEEEIKEIERGKNSKY